MLFSLKSTAMITNTGTWPTKTKTWKSELCTLNTTGTNCKMASKPFRTATCPQFRMPRSHFLSRRLQSTSTTTWSVIRVCLTWWNKPRSIGRWCSKSRKATKTWSLWTANPLKTRHRATTPWRSRQRKANSSHRSKMLLLISCSKQSTSRRKFRRWTRGLTSCRGAWLGRSQQFGMQWSTRLSSLLTG